MKSCSGTRRVHRSQETGVRGPEREDGGLRLEGRSQESEVRSQGIKRSSNQIKMESSGRRMRTNPTDSRASSLVDKRNSRDKGSRKVNPNSRVSGRSGTPARHRVPARLARTK